ncbi:DUF4314 domain-containing protein [Paractinoplanes globisporus]|uniref:DUF4314 domain-containing protein n=1 Tax=Paractinoplanes globisporus TaxID=113565 RepID=A0ABW6WEY4_9ACTN|nr:DUF4314 domain-containing protein [Actinoplanes globisporus]
MATPQAKAGDRVKLLHCADPHTTLDPGTLGTVTLVDSLGTIHVLWDNGIELGLVSGEDAFVVIEPPR